MHAGSSDRRRDPRGQVAIADQLNARSGLPDIGDQLFVTRAVEHHHHQVVHAAMQAASNVLQVVGNGSVQFYRILARRPHDDLFHIAVGGMQEAALFRRGQNRDRSRCAGSAEVGAFQRIDCNINAGNLPPVVESATHLLPDIQHGSVVAFALANHDGAAHWDGVHGLAHRLSGNLIAQRTVSLAHGARRGDGRLFDDPQEFHGQIAFNVLSETLGMRLGARLGWHE